MDRKYKIVLFIFVAIFLLATVNIKFNFYNKDNYQTYYYPAEVISQENGIVYFGGVDVDDPQVYTYATNNVFSANIPYLLTMDTRNTSNPEDDEILVVWACVN